MGSLDKIKLSEGIDAFAAKQTGPYILSDKLDGVSAMYVIDSGVPHMYTRGDGMVGQDISSTLMPLLKLPPLTQNTQNLAVRGELVISRDDFLDTSGKGHKIFANSRNMVSGIVNSKRPDVTVAERIKFVAYTVLAPVVTDTHAQMIFLKNNNFEVVFHQVRSIIPFQQIFEEFTKRKIASIYDIDGIVVASSLVNNAGAQNPTNAFAFKNAFGQATAVVVVSNVEWNLSKDGLFKPTLIFDAVRLSGVQIQRCSGFNALFVTNNCIGIGSKIRIIRAGEVIPHCEEVLSRSTNGEPLMPLAVYVWNNSKVDIMTTLQDNAELRLKILIHFTERMAIRGLGGSITRSLFECGIDNPRKILNVTHAQLLLIHGLNDISARNLIASIQDATEIAGKNSLIYMIASNAFGQGFGERKLSLFIKRFPYISDTASTVVPSLTELKELNGISDVSASAFLEGLRSWRAYMKHYEIRCMVVNDRKTIATKEPALSIFRNKNIVFTGVRSQDMEIQLRSVGALIQERVTKSTHFLICKTLHSPTTKLLKAVENGAIVICIDEVMTYGQRQMNT